MLLIGAPWPLMSCATARTDVAASRAAEKERRDVPDVPPVTRDGLRYEAVEWGRARGLNQNGGYLAVIDVASGREVRLIRVYGPRPEDGREADKQDVFIRAMAFEPDGRLRVEDERGGTYRVDTVTGLVTRP